MQELAFNFESLCFAPWRSPLLIAACRTQSGSGGSRTLLKTFRDHTSTAVKVHLELLEQSAGGIQIGHETVGSCSDQGDCITFSPNSLSVQAWLWWYIVSGWNTGVKQGLEGL